jgi:mRNA-degrading endonuclease RelE of RelBE toxin-antitoxin system
MPGRWLESPVKNLDGTSAGSQGFPLEGYWSARRGQYRVIYSIHDDEALVRVVRISHRADVYR